ncbi:MAG TPA: hypothetical protein PLO63_06595 [Syntrophales bacterium]|nr:hypothetical protein [Syntrophales bacterium]
MADAPMECRIIIVWIDGLVEAGGSAGCPAPFWPAAGGFLAPEAVV